MSAGHPEEGGYEVRLHGLGPQENMLGLNTFFSRFVAVEGACMHQLPDGKQWAQLWVNNREEVDRCMERSETFAQAGITIEQVTLSSQPRSSPPHGRLPALSRWPEPLTRTSSPYIPSYLPSASRVPHRPSQRAHVDILTYHRPEDEQIDQYEALLHQPESSLPWLTRDKGGRGFGGGGALPRNLYVVDLPLNLSEPEFRIMFEEFGSVEHCKLLSQLDSMGRRRGFILMSDHREAVDAMRRTDGKVIGRCRMDVSWALVQREAKQFVPSYGAMPNRVIHPPHTPALRSPTPDASVLVEGLDITLFPSSTAIRDLFSTFGRVLEVQVVDKTDTTISAAIRFEHPSSAIVLAESNGMPLGNSVINVGPLNHAAPAYSHRLYNQDRLLHFRQAHARSDSDESSTDPFAFSINQIRPHQVVSPSPLKANVQPFIPTTYSQNFASACPFSFQRDFINPLPKPVSMRRDSLDVTLPKSRQAALAAQEEADLAATVDKLLLGEVSNGETRESDQFHPSSGQNDSSDDSQSRTPPSSPHLPEGGDNDSQKGSDDARKEGSGDEETVIEDEKAVLGKGDRWSIGNQEAQWISTAW